MENRDRTADQGGQLQANQKPGQGGQKPGQAGGQKPGQGGQKPGQGGGQQGGREKRSEGAGGVTDDGRSTAGSEGRLDQGIRTGESDFEIEGGREGAVEIPNPEDDNDRGSRSGFRGNAAEESAFEDDEGEEGFGKNVNRNKDQNNPLSNPK